MAHKVQDPAAWERLALLLVARRHQLGYKKRKWFVAANIDVLGHGRNVDVVESVERMNLDANSLATLETAYQWKPGSIDAVLRGGDPQPIEDVEVVHDLPLPAVSAERMECRFIIDRLSEDQLPEALAVLRGMERR